MAARKNTRPAIAMTRQDHERLSRFAERMPEGPLADEFLAELDRARVVMDHALGPDVVRMGSTVRYSTDAGENRTVTLVFPGEADIESGRISVLTPIGIALIGLSTGQSIDWTARDGRVHRLTVDQVEQPAPASLAS